MAPYVKTISLLLLVILGMTAPSSGSVTNLMLSTNAAVLNQQFQGQDGIYPDTSLTLSIHLNVTAFTSSINVAVTFPHTVGTQRACDSYIDGTLFNCVDTPIIQYRLGKLPGPSDYSIAMVGSATAIYSNMASVDGATLSWTFANVTRQSAGDGIAITVKINPQMAAWGGIGQSHNVNVGILEDNVSTINQSQPVLILGPAFNAVSLGGGGSQVQAGDTINHTISITLTSFSTAAAQNIKVWIQLPYSLKYVSNSGKYYVRDPNAQQSMTHVVSTNDFSISIAQMNVTEQAVFTWQTKVLDSVLIGTTVSEIVTLTYYTADAANHYFNRFRSFDIAVRDLDLAGFTANVGFESSSALVVGQGLTWIANFSMPYGTLQNVELKGVFQSQDYSVSMTFLNAEVKTDMTTRSYSGSDISINQQARRKKRAIKSSTATLAVGTIVNSATSGYPSMQVKFSINYYLGSVTTPSASLAALQSLSYNGKSLYKALTPYKTIVQPVLYVIKTVQMEDNSVYPNIVRFNVTVGHNPMSNMTAYRVTILDVAKDFDIFFYNNMIPRLGSPGVTAPSDNSINYTKSELLVGETMKLSYRAQPSKEGTLLPASTSNFTAYVNFYASKNSAHPVDTIEAKVCIEKVEQQVSNLFLDHGFTVLLVIVGLLIGFVLTFLLLFLIYKICRHRGWGSVQPTMAINSGKLRGLLTDTGAAFKKGFKNMKNLSMVALDESLILILALKDKLRIHRELDSLDIVNTIVVDTEIENERNNAMVENTTQLVDSLRVNGDLNKGVADKCLGKFNMNLKGLDKKLDDEYDKEMEAVVKKLANKNKDKLEELQTKHDVEMENLENKIRDLPEKEQEELKTLLKQQQQTERDELTYLLKLEQDEASEKLRKEFAIRKRMGIKEEQGELLRDIAQNGRLNDEQLDWLLKEHKKNQDAVSILYDDEILRQRMKLEEKLAQRKALAAASEAQEEMHSDVLNSLASHEIQLIQRAKKNSTLTPDEADAMIEQAKKDMLSVKDNIEKERDKQENALHKRLSERKRAAMMEQEKKHQHELAELEKKQKEQQMSGQMIDPISLMESKQKLRSHQRSEVSDLENEIDREHAAELKNIRDALAQQAEKELSDDKEKLISKLKEEGMTDDQMKKLLKKHEKELEQLKEAQEKDREMQEENLRRALAKRRKEMNRRKEEERLENEQLREHENKIVDELLDKQVAMSETERERIMKEHEKNMMSLENSMALTKLQQKRMLEEKLAKKRAKQLEELEKKQLLEAKKKKKSAKHRDEDDDDYNEENEMSKAEVAMMKKHAEQRLAVAQGEKIELEQEIEEVEVEMMKARASALKDQEIRLAAMIADLQMQKAKEIAQIEGQQKAISSLKSNLMDDLNERGVLSNPDCQRVIEAHQQEQEKLSDRLESQKTKQEMLLQKRLAARIQQRQQSLVQLQENQIKEVYHSSSNNMAAKIRIAAMRHKHATEMDKFRNKMEKEMLQNLEELHRQIEISHMQAQQNQELQFLSGLVRLGQFQIEELNNVVDMMFPTKTAEEKKEIMARLTEGYTPPPPPKPDQLQVGGQDYDQLSTSNASTLEARIKMARSSSIKNAALGSQVSVQKIKKSKKKKVPTATLR